MKEEFRPSIILKGASILPSMRDSAGHYMADDLSLEDLEATKRNIMRCNGVSISERGSIQGRIE